MSWDQPLHSLEQHSKASASRSDVLRVLIWPGAIVATLLGATIGFGGPPWLVITLTITLLVLLAVYLVSFVWLLIVNPDALRSERYQIEKLAIERGVYGNSTVGLIDERATPRVIDEAIIREPDRSE